MLRISLHYFALCALLFSALTAHAAPIYKWEDEAGVVHFSTDPPHKNAKPADLPEITRGDVKLARGNLVSCESHGGIDCQAGPDEDGSVLCRDGFSAASPRFRFSCSTPKLEITDISEVTLEGTFSVFVRNSKAVKASNPAVAYTPIDGAETNLTGPREIEPFGIAEFKFQPNDKSVPRGPVNLAQLNLTCANCP